MWCLLGGGIYKGRRCVLVQLSLGGLECGYDGCGRCKVGVREIWGLWGDIRRGGVVVYRVVCVVIK